ncbi:MAG: ankyrin repeat domain-containing protein [Legionellales bacterium]|jgi:ankyrin repeat protein
MPKIQTVQLGFLAYQARLDLELYYDLDLPELSRQNIAHLRKLLLQSQPTGLTPQEVRLVQLVFEHSKFSHGTQYLKDIQNNQNTLQSLQMRVRAQQQTHNRHTKAGSRTDSYVFFAYGKRIPEFLQQDIDKITFRPSYLQNKNTFLYQRAFVTWSPNAGPQRRTSPPLLLGDSRFYHQHTSDTDKQYIYQQEGQAPFIWSVTDRQEILYGKDILWGLAYQMILHLRYIGGSYQQHVLDNLNDNSVQVLQEIFMPVASYPELKVPLQFNIEDEGVSIVQAVPVDTTQPLSFTEQNTLSFHQDMAQGKTLKIFDRQDELYENPHFAVTDYDKKLVLQKAVKYADIPLINKILSENNFDINEDYGQNSLLNHAIKNISAPKERMAVVKLLIAKGANPNQGHEGENAYYRAVEIKDKALFEYLLTVSCPHPQDSHIKTLPVLNKDKEMFMQKNTLDLICINGLVDWLPLAIAHGANIHHFPCSLYRNAAQHGHVKMVRALIAQGARLDEFKGIKTPLIVFAENGNVEGVKLLLGNHVDVYVEYDGKTALDFAKKNTHQAIIDLFKPYHIPENKVEYKGKKHAAVAVVTAQDPKTGKRVVLVGQRRNEDNTLDDEYRFPGGLVDPGDKDFIDAAKRELQEETGISLTAIKLAGKFTEHTVAKYSQVYEDYHFDIRFIHFHLLIDPAMLRVKADDDLGHVKWLPVENIRMARDQNGRKRGVFIEDNSYTLFNQSNVIVLESICYGGLDKPAFDQAMLVENFGYKKLMEYTRVDNVAGIEDLIADRVPMHSDLLSLAAKSGSKNAVKFYLKNSPEFIDVCPHPAVAAALGDHWEIFDLLYDEQMDQYSEGMVLNHCIRSQNLLKLVYCLNHFKININVRLKGDQYFITTAAIIGNEEIVQTLMQYGATLNPAFIGVDDNGIKIKAPLHVALTHKHAKLAIYLITKGADVNCPDNITRESVMRSSYSRMINVFKSMHEGTELAPLDINDRFDFQMTNYNKNAVTKAVATPGCEEVVQYIIDHKFELIDVNQLDAGTLTRYKDYYPELFDMLPEQTQDQEESSFQYYQMN